jgi:hypothetical protein
VEHIVKNIRVAHLGDLLKEQRPNWAKSIMGVIGVKQVATSGPRDLEAPDIILVANYGVLASFDDQRVKMDLDKQVLDAKDTHGMMWTLAFGACVPT